MSFSGKVLSAKTILAQARERRGIINRYLCSPEVFG